MFLKQMSTDLIYVADIKKDQNSNEHFNYF